jgi:hypothetical protein
VRSWIFLIACIAFTFYIIQGNGKLDELLAYWSGDEALPTSEELVVYISQGFYYLALLIGLVYVVRKFKRRHNEK